MQLGYYMDNKDYLKIKSKSNYFLFLLIYFLIYPIAKILYGRKNNWLVCERGNDAQDNGFVFFKYLVEKQPTINATYIISLDSPDYNKVKGVGKTIKPCSLKHFFLDVPLPLLLLFRQI